ncbi:MAG: hypothetical protein Kow0080_29720 [Candidatus Promineifilaceae bacterium]
MFQNRGFRSFIVVLAVFAAVMGLAVGINLVRAANTAVSPASVTATAGTAFTYQGQLNKSGSAVTDTCAFQFSLYDAASGGSQVGSTVTKSSVSVTDGLFTTELDFGSSAFDGNARYLQIAVKCTGESSYTTLNGRVALNAAPYALSLVPGASVQGNSGSSVFTAINTNTNSGNGLYGLTNASGGYGVAGWNLASSTGTGVYGNSAASAGTPYGVYGIASDSGSATSYGVYGKSNSSAGSGVGGIAPTNGVVGEASNTTGTTWGVFGRSNSASGYGVFGTNTNASGTGVRGDTINGSGVAGYVDWLNSGTGVGVYGSGGFYGTAGKFENATTSTPAVIITNGGGGSSPALVVTGTTHLEGAVTWKPVTSYLAVPPAAFQPSDNNSTFTQGGYYLVPTGASPETTFYAPVNLPHNAVITAVTFHWSDYSAANNGTLTLYRDNPVLGPESLAILSTTGSSGLSSTNTTTITSPTVDNSTYSYYFKLSLPDTNIYAYEIFIEYTINQPY